MFRTQGGSVVVVVVTEAAAMGAAVATATAGTAHAAPAAMVRLATRFEPAEASVSVMMKVTFPSGTQTVRIFVSRRPAPPAIGYRQGKDSRGKSRPFGWDSSHMCCSREPYEGSLDPPVFDQAVSSGARTSGRSVRSAPAG